MKMIHGLVLAGLVALAATVPTVLADETTRAQYKTAAEPICKANSEANEHILKGVRKKVRDEKLKPAGRQLTRAGTALKKTLRQIEALPMPTADEARLLEWQKRVGEEATLLQNVGNALIAENLRKAEVLSVKLATNARLTNAIVVPFGFTYCRLDSTKYT